jgi:hypothetical protein
LLEHHLHLGLHLCELSFVKRALFRHLGRRAEVKGLGPIILSRDSCLLDLLEDRVVLSDAHRQQLVAAIVFV